MPGSKKPEAQEVELTLQDPADSQLAHKKVHKVSLINLETTPVQQWLLEHNDCEIERVMPFEWENNGEAKARTDIAIFYTTLEPYEPEDDLVEATSTIASLYSKRSHVYRKQRRGTPWESGA